MFSPAQEPTYEVAPANATEPKVVAATSGATAGVIVTSFVLYLIDNLFYGGGAAPQVVELFVGLLITSGMTFAGGYIARHVNRAPIPPTNPAPAVAAGQHEAP